MKLERRQLELLKDALRATVQVRAKDTSMDLEDLSAVIELEEFLKYRGPGGLTRYQLLVIDRVIFQGYGEKELGQELGVSQQAISYALTSGVTKIYRHLVDPKDKPKGSPFTEESLQLLKSMYIDGYGSKSIAIVLDLKLNTIRNKIRGLREAGEFDGIQRVIRKDPQV